MDLTLRRPVWAALSDLFLDTEVTLSRAWRIERLTESSYTVEERDWILRHEVCPICRYNLLSVAGVWTGFQLSWLEEQILIRTKSPFFAWRLSRLGFYYSPLFAADWQESKLGIQALRSSNTGPTATQKPSG